MTVAVIGGGLAGSLLALALRERGLEVLLIDPGPRAGAPTPPHGGEEPQAAATALSYGAVAAWAAPPTALGRLMRQAPRCWEQLQRRHGDLGWRRRGLRLHGRRGAGAFLRLVTLPCAQVEAARFAAASTGVLAEAGVGRLRAAVRGLSHQGEQWRLQLADGGAAAATAVVLAAGAGCRHLWPALDGRLLVSWAGVLELERWPPGYRRGRLLLPARFTRLDLERRAPLLAEQSWVVDAGLVPWGDTALLGQISVVAAGGAAGPPPPPQAMEQRLRRALEPFDPALARAAGRYRQVPVAFCSHGLPLLGPVAGAPGLWQFTGFSAAFAQVPVLAPLQAGAIAGNAAAAAALARLTSPA